VGLVAADEMSASATKAEEIAPVFMTAAGGVVNFHQIKERNNKNECRVSSYMRINERLVGKRRRGGGAIAR
jgi:hypothetical protein